MARRNASRTKGRTRHRSVGTMPVGTIRITPDGLGFADTPEGKFFIPPKFTNGAMDGDTVRLHPRSGNWRKSAQKAAETSGRRAPVAAVDRVIERAHEKMVGMYVELDGIGYIVPQDSRLDYLVKANRPHGKIPELAEGDIVLVTFDTYPSRHESPSATILEVIGHEGDSGIMEDIIAARHGFSSDFSRAAIEESNSRALDVREALTEPDRRDIRDRFVLTIDPADARDYDDALSLDYVGGTMRLGVHIADVSSYVPFGSALDADARKRGTSVYFPDRVIPMLPERLSNGLCSLNPDEDRLAFTVDIYLDNDCNVQKTELYPSVIRSRLRLDYSGVQDMFDGIAPYPTGQTQTVLDTLRKVSHRLFAKRIRRGALDFESLELKVTFDDEGKPDGIIKRCRTDATDLVEEAMILANECVASFMLQAGAPMVFRIHDEPVASSIEELVPVLREFGYAKDGPPLENRRIQAILDDVRGKPAAPLVNMLLLRAMKQAVYRKEYTTHFGLASDGYTHFTSPIRRYPDLMAHRLLRRRLYDEGVERGLYSKEAAPNAICGLEPMVDQLQFLCERSSLQEREAEKASLEALDIKICEYMEQFVGDRFAATIMNVMQFGFFVRIENGCEGLVPVGSLPGWFEYDDERRMLVDTEGGTGKRYRLGQQLMVELVRADAVKGKLEFRVAS